MTLHAPELVEGKQNIPFSRLSHKFHTSWPRTFACCETLNGFDNVEEGKVDVGEGGGGGVRNETKLIIKKKLQEARLVLYIIMLSHP